MGGARIAAGTREGEVNFKFQDWRVREGRARTSFKPSLNLRDGGGGFEVEREYGMGAVKGVVL